MVSQVWIVFDDLYALKYYCVVCYPSRIKGSQVLSGIVSRRWGVGGYCEGLPAVKVCVPL